MRTIVCIKQVPDTLDVRFDKETNTLIRVGLESVINPFDLYGLEAGLRLRERYGGTVSVLSMGPSQVASALCEAMSMGADDVRLLSGVAFAGSDTLATSRALSMGVQKMGAFDLIICGRQAIDGDTGQVGPELAEMLGVPYVGCVVNIHDVSDGFVVAARVTEEGFEKVKFSLPALLTVAKGVNEPRFPTLKGKLRAARAQVPVWSGDDIGAHPAEVGLRGSPTRVCRMFKPEREAAGEVLEGDVHQQVAALLERFREIGVVPEAAEPRPADPNREAG